MKSIFLNKISNIVSRFSSTVSELFSVIRGPRPANLDCRITSGNDGYRWRLFSSCKFFNYPSPDTTVSTDKPSKEGLLYFSICLTRGRYNKRGADNTTSIGKPNACIRCRCVGRPLGQTIKFVLLALFAWCSTLYAGAKRTAHYCFYCLLRGIKVLPLVATGGEVLNNITFKGLDVVRQYAALLERRVQSRKAQAVTRQTKHIRNLLPQCASDATGFLSDVYKKSTRAQKFLADGVQYGRSMIEMLGVLAIIGVLSVGGIAGYSKAMIKWKINKTIEQIEQITHNSFTAFANQKKWQT